MDDLVNPERFDQIDTSFVERYYGGEPVAVHVGKWLFRMVNTLRPLEEKMSLFLHQVFPVAWGKSEHGPSIYREIQMFRDVGLTNFKTVLLQLSKDPAMIFWLDNNENHKNEINENFGRELLELFSMGVGNYSESDIKNASRAFTGWTFDQPLSLYPYGHHEAVFKFASEDHDFGDKEFLGQKGNFDGEDIIDIIVKQPATARFLSRHLYNFFVADEAQVPAWMDTPVQDPETIQMLEEEYFRSGYDIRSMLRVLLNSDAFKNTRFSKIKGPIETVIGTLGLVGDWSYPKPGFESIFEEMKHMGQEILNPPSVEGWHTGKEWIDGGTLVRRINFIADYVGDVSYPGVQDLVQNLIAEGAKLTPKELVDGCLRLLGHYELSMENYNMLVEHAGKNGDISTNTKGFPGEAAQILQMIVATKEYLYA